MTDLRDLRAGSLYRQARDEISAWVAWFKPGASYSEGRPGLGEVLLYLGRGSAVVKDRGSGGDPDSWCFLREMGVVEVFNSSFAATLEEIRE